ncbi:MAG TPA: NADH:flavin oxidoreductase [Actinomycetota bacterium]|nr:NADH:flavin oxidoreductase [Actinomycetota bacterium]
MSDPFASAKLGPVTLRNCIIKAATFEGRTPKRVVTDDLIEFHRRVAAGGVGMSTVAYCAVSREGTTDGRNIVLTGDAVPGLLRLTDAIHSEGAAACAQIGHSGPVANPAGTRSPALGPSRVFAPISLKLTRAMSEADIARVTGDFAAASKAAVAGGFDALELHLGHNYLLSAFLSPKLNKRRDRWGGDIESRAAFPRRVVKVVREAVGSDVAVTAKLNMADGVRGGLQEDESIAVAQMLEADGALDAITLTGGSSLVNPMYLFRGDVPIAEMAQTMPPVMRAGFRLTARRFMRSYPFEEAYFLPQARRFRAALKMPLVLLGGINRLDTITSALDEGFSFVAMARALLCEPELPIKMRADAATQAACIHCNKCMPTIYTGTRCVIV